MDPDRVPVIVGVGRYTQRGRDNLADAQSPVGLMATAAVRAATDAVTPPSATGPPPTAAAAAGSPDALLRGVVAVGTVGMFFELRWDPP